MTKIMKKFTQNDITHLFAAQKYIQFVCFPFALFLSKMCVPWAVLFCTDLTDTTDIFARTRIFTECHGISVHLHPCFSVCSV